jgi:hypothetical protein
MDGISNERGFKISTSDFDLDRLNIADMFAGMVNNYIKTYYKLPVSTSQQQTFKDFMESYKPRLTGDHVFYKYGIENIYVDVMIDTNRLLRTPAQHIQLTLKLEVVDFTPDNVGLILFLDGHLRDVRNMGILSYMKKARMVDLNDPHKSFVYNKLNNVYGKFI